MLGAKEESVQSAANNIEQDHPGIQIVGRQNGYFGVEDEPDIVERINESNADVLLIAISSPKKENLWNGIGLNYKYRLSWVSGVPLIFEPG